MDMATVWPFSQKTLKVLSMAPVEGETHHWLALAATGLAAGGMLTRENCGRFLRDVCGAWVSHRAVPEREIGEALRLAYDRAATRRAVTRARVQWPVFDERARAEAAAAPALFDGVTDTGMTADEALRGLFAPGELVCAGLRCECPVIRPVEVWMLRASDAQFVVANPMKGFDGLTKEGKPSARCQSNVGARRYVVAEFDDPDFGKPAQARVASALAEALPLRMVVDSGGKSLHCWYDVRGVACGETAAFFAAAVKVGADATRWDPCGWVRMPGGLRRKADGTAVRQRVVYWNPGCRL